MPAEVIRRTLFALQVCVPTDWTDEQVIEFAENDNPCGTTNGWSIRRQDSEQLSGDDERVSCEEHTDHIHIIVEA